MNKFFLFVSFFYLLKTSIIFSQVYIDEDFKGLSQLPAGWTTSGQAGNWGIANTANAGSTAPELRLNWAPQFNATTRVQLPYINLSENESGKLVFTFKHSIDWYGSSFNIGASYRIDTGNWVNFWINPVNSNISPRSEVLILEEDFPSQAENIQFALFFSGNSNNLNYWYIDDIVIMAPPKTDLALTEVNVDEILEEETTVNGKVINKGTEPLYSFDVAWSIGDGPEAVRSFYGLNLGLFEGYSFDTGDMLPFSPGQYDLNVRVFNVNGGTDDANAENNEIGKTIMVPGQLVPKKPLFESFTSATCPPCYSFNTNFFNNFINQNIDDLAIIKYQMNWPGSGDIYYNADGGMRRNYYGVNSVPSLILNGDIVATSSTLINSAFSQALQKKTILDIIGAFRVQEDNVIIEASITPYASLTGTSVHVAVLEKTTTGNVGSNGETSFKYVMMKMLPNGNGTSMDLISGSETRIEETVDMSNTDVEQMSDLIVLVFVQDNATKDVLQAQFILQTDDGAPLVWSNIENNAQDVSLWKDIEIIFNQTVTDSGSKGLTNEDLNEILSFYVTGEPENTVSYTASLNEFGNKIIITPNSYLLPSTSYTLDVEPVAGYWGTYSDPFQLTFTTRDPMGAPQVVISPGDGSENLERNTYFNVSFGQQIRNVDGSWLTHESVSELFSLTSLDPERDVIPLTVIPNADYTEVRLVPQQLLDISTTYALTVDPVMGEDGDLSEATSAQFTTRQSIGAPDISLNLTDGAQDVTNEHEFVLIFTQPVKTPGGEDITIENVGSLIFVRNADAPDQHLALSFEINGHKNIFHFVIEDDLPNNSTFEVVVDPLAGLEDDLTETFSVTFHTRETVGAPLVLFSLEEGTENVPIDQVFTITFNQAVRNPDGSAITNENIDQLVWLIEGTTEDEMVAITATINEEKTEVTITTTDDLLYNQLYVMGVEPLLGVDDDLSEPQSVSFTTVSNVSAELIENQLFELYPNPVSDRLYLQLAGPEATVKIYNSVGILTETISVSQKSVSIDVRDYAEGIYFIEISQKDQIKRMKVIVSR